MGRRTPARRTPGRPPVVADTERVARLLEAVGAGVPIAQACLHAGISESAHFRAMDAGAEAEEAAEAGGRLDDRQTAYREYRESFLRARAAVAAVHVALIGKAARGGQVIRETTRREPDGTIETDREFSRGEWKASAWLLSKSFPGDFGDRKQVEHSGPGGGPIEHASPAEEALQTLAERLAAVRETQRAQLPGGWDPGAEQPALSAGPAERVDQVDDVADAEIVDEDGRR